MLNLTNGSISWAPALVVLGWMVVHYLSQKRDINKFQRELIVKVLDGLLDQIQKIQELSIEYHTAMERSKNKEVKLRSWLQDLGMQHRLLPAVKISDTLQFASLHKNLRQAITAEHFADDFESTDIDTTQISERIAACCIHIRTHFIEMKFDQVKF